MGGAQGSKVGGGDAVGALGFLTYKPSHSCCPGLDWGPWGVWVGGVEEQSAPSVACGERCQDWVSLEYVFVLHKLGCMYWVCLVCDHVCCVM